MKKIILTTLSISILFACKKKTEEVIIPPAVDPITGEWYMHLVDADALAPVGTGTYAYRAAGINAAGRSNISFTTNASLKILYKFTKEAENKYSISISNYPGQYLSYQTNNIVPYELRMFFSLNAISDNNLYTFEKVAGTTDTYLIKSVSNPTKALGASIQNGTSIYPNFIVAGASFTYQKWKLEK